MESGTGLGGGIMWERSPSIYSSWVFSYIKNSVGSAEIECFDGLRSALTCHSRRVLMKQRELRLLVHFRNLQGGSVCGNWGMLSLFWFFKKSIFMWNLVFLWDWIWTQSFVLANRTLYLLSHTSSPFCSGYFGDGASKTISPGWPGTSILQILASQIARITGVNH
jgi:hypothetical protein